jgi:hypothetical protein
MNTWNLSLLKKEVPAVQTELPLLSSHKSLHLPVLSDDYFLEA